MIFFSASESLDPGVCVLAGLFVNAWKEKSLQSWTAEGNLRPSNTVRRKQGYSQNHYLLTIINHLIFLTCSTSRTSTFWGSTSLSILFSIPFFFKLLLNCFDTSPPPRSRDTEVYTIHACINTGWPDKTNEKNKATINNENIRKGYHFVSTIDWSENEITNHYTVD